MIGKGVFRNRPAQTLSHFHRYRLVRAGQDYGKLVPAVAPYDIHLAHVFFQQAGQFFEQFVTRGVAEQVVVVFEVVCVHHQEGYPAALFECPCYFAFQCLFQVRLVVKHGHAVPHGQALQFFF